MRTVLFLARTEVGPDAPEPAPVPPALKKND